MPGKKLPICASEVRFPAIAFVDAGLPDEQKEEDTPADQETHLPVVYGVRVRRVDREAHLFGSFFSTFYLLHRGGGGLVGLGPRDRVSIGGIEEHDAAEADDQQAGEQSENHGLLALAGLVLVVLQSFEYVAPFIYVAF